MGEKEGAILVDIAGEDCNEYDIRDIDLFEEDESSEEVGDKRKRNSNTVLNTDSLMHYVLYISGLKRSEMYHVMDKKTKKERMTLDLAALENAGFKCSKKFWKVFSKKALEVAKMFSDDKEFIINLKAHFGLGENKLANVYAKDVQVFYEILSFQTDVL